MWRMRVALVGLLTLVLGGVLGGVLVACGGGGTGSGGKDAKGASMSGPVSIKAGDCFGGATLGARADAEAEKIKTDNVTALQDDPTWRDPRACANPHRVEVYAVVGIAPDVAKRITGYADLLNTETSLYSDIRQAVNTACSRHLPGVKRALRSTSLKVDVSPAVNGDVAQLAWNAVPYESWKKGNHEFVCMLTQKKDGTETMTDFFDKSGQRSALHLCFDAMSKAVECSGPHTLESLAIITANRAVAGGQLPGKGAFTSGKLNIPATSWRQLDKACSAFLDANSTGHPGLAGVTSVYNNQWPVPPNDNYSFYCDATSPYGTRPKERKPTSGSVFDKSGVTLG